MKTLISFMLLLLQAITITPAITQSVDFGIYRCRNRGNFTTTADQQTLATALDSLTAKLVTAGSHGGFYHSTAGTSVNAVALCRSDIGPNDCENCVNNSISSLKQNCPNQKQAAIWNSYCMLHYSDRKIIGILDNWTFGNESSTVLAPNVTEFNSFMSDLAIRLRKQAVGDLLRKMAVGNVTVSNSLAIYMMMQCTPDLSSDQCNECLEDTVGELWDCCSGRVAARAFTPSCFVRYSFKAFYGATEFPPGMVDNEIWGKLRNRHV